MFSLSIAFVTFVSISGQIYVIDDTGGKGRVFDGFGAISGGGATSKLLVNYPVQQRDEILDLLFKPNYGASLDILKVEIGSDVQSTEGTEATHMKTPQDENFRRGYEWWMMVEAKKRNPSIKIYGLPWGWPGWIGNDVFADANVTASYIVKWILGANSTYGLHVDYIGLWNERMYDKTYIKTLRKMLDKSGLQKTLIIAADNFHWTIADDILADTELDEAVYAIGVHYPKTKSTSTAVRTGKPLWASEDSGNTMWNSNYVNGYMTGTIAWPVIASYYPGLPYYPAGLMTASEPWSGFFPEPVYIWLPAHTTQFTAPGWQYLAHGWGVGHLNSGGTYVTLVQGSHVTIVIQTIGEETPVQPQNATFQIKGTFSNVTHLNVWYTSLKKNEYFINKGQMKDERDINSLRLSFKKWMMVVNGEITLQVGEDELWTLTTMTTGNKGGYSKPPSSKPFPLPYKDNFETYVEYEEPYMFTPQVGSFEVAKVNGSHGNVMRQTTISEPISWCIAEGIQKPIALLGNVDWSDLYVGVDFQVQDLANKADGVVLASRVKYGGCAITLSSAVLFELNTKTQSFKLSTNFLLQPSYAEGNYTFSAGWNNASLLVQGSSAVGHINGKQVFSTESLPPGLTAGFAGVGTIGYGLADFDNFIVTTPNDALQSQYISKF